MPYKFIPETATADVAVECTGDLNEVFASAGMSVQELTVEHLDKVEQTTTKEVEITSDSMDQLLIDFIDELIFLKDTEHLIFSDIKVNVGEKQDHAHLTATLKGEQIKPDEHTLGTDVKAITYHQFKLEQEGEQWKAHFILDI